MSGLQPLDFFDRPLELDLCSLVGLSSVGFDVSKHNLL